MGARHGLTVAIVLLSSASDSQYCTMPSAPAPLPPALLLRLAGDAGAAAPAAGVPPPSPPAFSVVWNMVTAPCEQCQNSSHVDPGNFGIRVNAGDAFDGDEIVCLYRELL